MDAIVRGEYKPPEELYPAIDPQLRAVITKAMAKLPDDRYATCAEFAAALREPAAPMKLITQVNPPPPLSTSIAPPQQGKARGPSPLLFLLLIPVLLAVAGFGILSFGASRGLWSLPWGPAGEPDAGSGSSAAVTLPVVPALPIVAAGEDAATPLAAASAGADAATAGADAETAGPDAGPPDVGAAPIDAGPRPAACVPSVSDLATNLRNGLVSGGPKAVAALEAALGGDTLFTFEDGLAPSPGTLAADEITSGDLDGDGTPEQLLTVLFSTPVAGGFVRQATLLAVFQKQPRGYCLVRRFSESVRHCPSSFERALRHDFMIQGGGLLIYRQKSSSCAPPAISVEQTIYPLKGGVLMDGPVSPVELQ